MKTNHSQAIRILSILSMSVVMAGCGDAGGGYDENFEGVENNESAASATVLNQGAVLRVTASALNLRKGAGTSHQVIEVLLKNDQLTVVSKSGQNGWYNVQAPSKRIGWVSASYVMVVSGSTDKADAPNNSGSSGQTCDPKRAVGAVGKYQKALHDSLAWAEGTRGYSKDGYNVMFSYKIMSSCQSHPNKCHAFGSSCSTAAGRYQFLTSTWNGTKNALNLKTFEPENQELGAQYLVTKVRKVTVPSSRPMTASEFSNAMSKLSYEWASLPPGRYGQPSKTHTQMRNFYCGVAGC